MLHVVALPGFTRAPQHLQRLADACGARGWSVVRPALAPRSMPFLYMRRGRLRGIAEQLASSLGPGPVVVAGHSAGGAAGTYLASAMLAHRIEVRGLVLIDAVESPNRLIGRSLPMLRERGIRVAAVLADPSPCNRNGAIAAVLDGVPEARITRVTAAGHGAIEGAGIEIYRRACGDQTSTATADRFLATVVESIAWAAGSEDRLASGDPEHGA